MIQVYHMAWQKKSWLYVLKIAALSCLLRKDLKVWMEDGVCLC